MGLGRVATKSQREHSPRQRHNTQYQHSPIEHTTCARILHHIPYKANGPCLATAVPSTTFTNLSDRMSVSPPLPHQIVNSKSQRHRRRGIEHDGSPTPPAPNLRPGLPVSSSRASWGGCCRRRCACRCCYGYRGYRRSDRHFTAIAITGRRSRGRRRRRRSRRISGDIDNGEQGIPEGCHGRAYGEEESVERPKRASHSHERDGLVHRARHEKGAHNGSEPPPGYDNAPPTAAAFASTKAVATAVSAISTSSSAG